MLALGIGATSAIFSLVSAAWLKPLPFADEDRLVSLWIDLTAIGGPPRVEISPANYADWQARAQSFESMAPIVSGSFNLTGDGGEPERLAGVRTTSSLFATIGLAPLLGRTFVPDDGTRRARRRRQRRFLVTSPWWRPRGRRPHDHARWLPPCGRRCRAAGFSFSER